ncbi:platelet glycoprotein Ib beta chain [Lepisosteus oculatus]|uniref:platelet glycoprotein Ib beta chain n=1 Tax=Lepisosteus oculatus TaxID=7918 RepID=UPI0035F51A95
MKGGARLFQLLAALLPLLVMEGCPAPCTCRRGTVDCSSRHLRTDGLPAAFPSDATRIRLHDNRLSSIPAGLFDRLPVLQGVSLHGNPWACDCGLLYLRAWLLRQEHRGLYRNVTCSSPPGLRGRLVMYLAEEEVLSSCQYWYCDLAVLTQACLFLFVLLQAVLLVLVVVFLRRFHRLAEAARGGPEESSPADADRPWLKARTE